MYLDFFGLLEKPFSLTPDPKYFFAGGCHAEARDLLRYGVREREGFMCFAGGAGTGKTTLLRTVLEGFGQDVVTALVLNPYLSEEDLLRIILTDFGVATRDELDSDAGRRLSKQELLDRLNHFLLNLSMQGRAAVLVVDEAQNLPLPVMEQIRLLSNLETSKSKLLQIVLAGQLGLRTLLQAPELSQLAQRVSVRYTLRGFDETDIDRYIDHRLRIAGSDGDIVFDAGAVQRIYQYTEGVPRLVNLLCDRALLAAYAQRSKQIGAHVIDRAAETLDLAQNGIAPPVERPQPTVAHQAPAAPAPRVPMAPARAQAPARVEAPVARRSFSFAMPTTSQMAGGLAAVAAALLMAVMVAPWLSARNGLEPAATPRAEATQSLPAEDAAGDRFGASAPAELARPSGAFTVYLSSFRRPDDDQLVDLRRRVEASGMTTFLIGADVPGQGRLHRLIVGDFDDQQSARTAAGQLRTTFGVAHAEAVAVADVTGS